jgi:PQQ-like domain
MTRTIIISFLALLGIFGFGQETQTPEPLWQLSFDIPPGSLGEIYNGESVIYYFEDDQLHVIDVQTGEQLWQIDYSLPNKDSTGILLVAGDGLIFIPKTKTLDALDERTGEVVWTYTSEVENLDAIVKEAVNETGIYYDAGYIFVQTRSYLTALNAKTGIKLWRVKKDLSYGSFQVLTDDFVVGRATEIREEVGGRPLSFNFTFIDMKIGQKLWTIGGGWVYAPSYNILFNDETYIYISEYTQNRFGATLSRYDLKTGTITSECPMLQYPLPEELRNFEVSGLYYDLVPMVVDDQYIYAIGRGHLRDIYRIPLCTDQPISEVEPVSETLDRYFVPTLMYAYISPYEWAAGPYNGYFLFQKEDSLLKVPVPEESFSYLYHDKTAGTFYTAPRFANIDPTSYEVVPNISGKIYSTGVGNDLIVVYSTVEGEGLHTQIIDFDSLKTIFKTRGGGSFITSGIFLASNLIENKREITAFKLNR